MNLQKKALSGVFWSIIQKWGSQLVSTAVFLLLARLLGAKAFGLVALANVYIAFAEIFLDQGLPDAIIQRESVEKEHLDTAFWTSILIGSTLAAVSVIGADIIANLFKEPQLAPVVRWLSLGFIINAFSGVQSALLKRDLKFRLLAIRSLIGTVMGGVVGITMALMNFGIWSLVAKHLVFSGAGVLLMWSVSDWRPSFQFSKKHFKELFSFGINITGFNFFNFFNRRSDDLLIGYFLGPVALGYYSVAYRLLLIMIRLLTGVISTVAFPTFSRMQDDLARMRNAFYRVTQFTSLFAMPCFLGMAVIAPELVLGFFGEEWRASIPVMQALSVAGIIQSISHFNSNILLAVGRVDWRLKLNILNASVNVVGFLIAVKFGIVAVAISFAIRGLLVYPIYLFAVKRLINIDFVEYGKNLASPLFSSVAMALVIIGVKHFTNITLNEIYLAIIYSMIGILIYIILISLTSPAIVSDSMKIVQFRKARK